MASITCYEAIRKANAEAGLNHTAGMTTAQIEEYHKDEIRSYKAHKLAAARANGFATVAEHEACFDYCHRS